MAEAGLVAAVLAGGQSRRMGRDKARLCWRGEPLLERAVRVARAAAGPGLLVLIVGRERPPDWSGPDDGVRFLPDEGPGAGPLRGLATALRCAGGPVLLLPCDMPLLDVAALRWLAAEGRGCQGTHGVVTCHQGRTEPLFSIYLPACLQLLAGRLGGDDLSLRGLIAAGSFDLAEAPDWLLPALLNVNTPEELRGLG